MAVLVYCLRVIDCDVIDLTDLPELTSIQLGAGAFEYCSRAVFESD